ncbi:hypothetical protein BS47DRAFT_1362553 [Hydnum rufescens UP504]|uniref:Uncharacterized protein n=1 Tax=Hydnum rufescens UP504 TaxID=1448309 RepID=A0A9P6AWG3_9AGAM|nr:hypothetical protein BS47DRAFT_1362553 [Hydnum rufescens UP504]
MFGKLHGGCKGKLLAHTLAACGILVQVLCPHYEGVVGPVIFWQVAGSELKLKLWLIGPSGGPGVPTGAGPPSGGPKPSGPPSGAPLLGNPFLGSPGCQWCSGGPPPGDPLPPWLDPSSSGALHQGGSTSVHSNLPVEAAFILQEATPQAWERIPSYDHGSPFWGP